MPIFPGLGKAATYVGRALGGTLESNMARVAAKAETKVGRKYLSRFNTLSRLDRAGKKNATIQRGMTDPLPKSETVRIQKEARRNVQLRERAGENVGKVGTEKRRGVLSSELGNRETAYRTQMTRARTMQLNRSVRRGSVGLAAGMAMSGKGPNESRTSYRGPGPTPGLRKPMGTGRFAG
jgi:hypothetical protein